jgi:hypothetical protein
VTRNALGRAASTLIRHVEQALFLATTKLLRGTCDQVLLASARAAWPCALPDVFEGVHLTSSSARLSNVPRAATVRLMSLSINAGSSSGRRRVRRRQKSIALGM